MTSDSITQNRAKPPWLCGQAWGGLVIEADGKMKPCCRFRGSYSLKQESPSHASPFNEIREQMLAGHPPAGCSKCVLEESAGLLSKRQRSDRLLPNRSPTQTLSPVAKPESLKYLEINLSTLCNLRCVMCSPHRSSAWNRDASKAGYEPAPLMNLRVDQLDRFLAHAETIEILGGETFLAPNLTELLEKIAASCSSKHLTLIISTNLTAFPGEKIKKILSEFQRLQIFGSIDAVNERNDYIRYPSKWNIVQKNLAKFLEWQKESRNMKLSVAATVSAFSYAGLPELLDWWMKLVAENEPFLPADRLWLNPVVEPEFQSVQVLPRSVREAISEKIRNEPSFQFGSVMKMVNFSLYGDRPELHSKLLEWVSKIDAGRDLKAKDCVPEIFTPPSMADGLCNSNREKALDLHGI